MIKYNGPTIMFVGGFASFAIGLFSGDSVVSPFLVQAGVLLFILGVLVGWLVGRRSEQPGCYGRVRQVRDIKREDKIAIYKLNKST